MMHSPRTDRIEKCLIKIDECKIEGRHADVVTTCQ